MALPLDRKDDSAASVALGVDREAKLAAFRKKLAAELASAPRSPKGDFMFAKRGADGLPDPLAD
jgi:hypothetical protein